MPKCERDVRSFLVSITLDTSLKELAWATANGAAQSHASVGKVDTPHGTTERALLLEQEPAEAITRMTARFLRSGGGVLLPDFVPVARLYGYSARCDLA